jgi:hypothetical protein
MHAYSRGNCLLCHHSFLRACVHFVLAMDIPGRPGSGHASSFSILGDGDDEDAYDDDDYSYNDGVDHSLAVQRVNSGGVVEVSAQHSGNSTPPILVAIEVSNAVALNPPSGSACAPASAPAPASPLVDANGS